MGNSCGGQGFVADDEFHVPQTGFRIPVRTVKRMGWKPDHPDFRDLVLELPRDLKAKLPKKVDLRPKDKFEIYDQGKIGSCTANAIGACFHFDQVKQGFVEFTPSRLFIYYNERSMEGTVEKDSGALIRDGIKSLAKIGVCSEAIWPYADDDHQFKQRPTDRCYNEAAKNRAKSYARIPHNLEDMKAVLNKGFPFSFGFIVLNSFMTVTSNGKMSMPQDTDSVLGGHAVCCVGYDDDLRCMIVRNSWSNKWGDGGYFYMPYDYIAHPQLARDFWYIQTIEGNALPAVRMFKT